MTIDPITLVLADDQVLVRGGLRAILEAQPDLTVLAEAGDGQQAIETVRRLGPDVVLMDIRMPGTDGLDATRILLADPTVQTRVLILTTFDLDDYVYAALQAGASGFLLKDARPAELVAGVRAVALGETQLAPALTRRLVDLYLTRPSGGDQDRRLAALTEREIDVLRLLAEGCSNGEVAAKLYLSLATVKTHVARILAKLQLRDRVHAVIAAYETGLVQPGDHGSSAHQRANPSRSRP